MYLTDRIELIEDNLIVAGSAKGSFQLLKMLLESWTAHAAVAFVTDDFEPWIAALSTQYKMSSDEIEELIAADRVEPLVGKLNFTQLFSDEWQSVRDLLKNILMSANQSNIRFATGSGFAIKIGENALTPDFVIAQGHADFRFSERHLEGVPEIVFETVVPNKDLYKLQKLYASHGIPEVVLVDLKKHEFVVLQNRGGYYHPTSLLKGGVYHSVAVGGLVININLLWNIRMSPEQMFGAVLLDESEGKHNSIINYSRMPNLRNQHKKPAIIRPGQILFEPRIGYDPGTLTFEEFISWSPRPKFEIDDNRLVISSRKGTRNMIGMLLQCIGLREAVAALPLEDWITAIAERRLQIASSIHIKKFIAHEAKRTAQILREDFGKYDLRTFGWIDEPPGMWTSLRIVDMQPENGGPPHREIRRLLQDRSHTGVEFIGVDSLTPAERSLLEKRSLIL